jgi:DNA-directed RNA polymerase subunit RPC12/RpoP
MTPRQILGQLLETSLHDTPCPKCGHRAMARLRSTQGRLQRMNAGNVRSDRGVTWVVCVNCDHVMKQTGQHIDVRDLEAERQARERGDLPPYSEFGHDE